MGIYDHPELLFEIEETIIESLRNLNTINARREKCTEPQVVANLIYCLCKEFKTLRSKYNFISVGGVFVHQQPQVISESFPANGKAIELGDLLLVCNHRRKDNTISRVAKLFQVKLYDDEDYLDCIRENENQIYLYSFWPEYKYIRSGLLNGAVRKITGPNRQIGAQYLLMPRDYINDSYLNSATFMTVGNTIILKDPLLIDLVNFVYHNAGREFVFRPNNNINWDQLITDLLDQTSNRLSSYIGAGRKKGRRGQNIEMFLAGSHEGFDTLKVSGELFKDYSYGDVPPEIDINNDNFIDDYGSGISVVELTIDETKM